ncbi:zinc finger, CCHC-type containing protein [Tanacetum coccineum]
MCLRLFQFSLRDQASNWRERLPAGSITTWEDLTTCFLAQFFLLGRTAKLHNNILMFQQHHGDSLSEAWTWEEERSKKTDMTTGEDFEKPIKTETKILVKEAKKEDEAENEPNRKAEKKKQPRHLALNPLNIT